MWSYNLIMAAAAALLLAGTTGCGSQADKNDTQQASGAAVAPQQTTYLKISHTVQGDTVYADTTTLRLLSQDRMHVYGSYFWRPPGKDGRTGAISGVRDADTITGLFSYTQEGGHYQDSVKIVVSDAQVVITQQSSEGYSIADTLTQSE